MTMKMRDALRVIDQHRQNGVVVSAMTGSRGWNDTAKDQSTHLPTGGAMGKASSVALGIALAQPRRKVVIVDADGSLEMNLGSLVTIANKAPANLVHVVLENGVYAITGGQPIPGEGVADFAGVAKQSGYKAVFDFKDLEDFASQAGKIFNTPGPVFVTLHVEPEIENRPINQRPRATRRTVDAAKEVKAALAKQ